MSKFKLRELTLLALLVAIEIILSRFLSINAWNLKIGFNFIPIVIAAILFGPVAGGVVAAMGDFIGAVLFPIGAYFPGFTFTAFLMGLVFGLFLHRGQEMKNILAAVIINQLLLGLGLNSFWISLLYGSPYLPLLMTRALQCALLILVQTPVIKTLAAILKRNLR